MNRMSYENKELKDYVYNKLQLVGGKFQSNNKSMSEAREKAEFGDIEIKHILRVKAR